MRNLLIDIALVFLFAGLTALAASLEFPFLPYHPTTIQIIPVLLSGAILGSTRGPLSQILFLCLGLFGLPLFSALAPAFPVPSIDASPLFRHTGLKTGWLLGFAAASYITGRTFEYAGRFDTWTAFLAINGGLALLYVLGIVFPAMVLRIPVGLDFLSWAAPFFAADFVKTQLALLFMLNLHRVKPRVFAAATAPSALEA